jgi:hypothetical protein
MHRTDNECADRDGALAGDRVTPAANSTQLPYDERYKHMIHLDPDRRYPEGSATPEQSPILPSPPVLEHAMAFWRSAMVLGAYELGIFAELAKGPRTADQLIRTLGLRADAVVDMLEALVKLELIEPIELGYRTTREASIYLDPGKPTYVGAVLDMAGHAMRGMVDLADQMRIVGTHPKAHSSLVDRMWSDIADIFSAASLEDCG